MGTLQIVGTVVDAQTGLNKPPLQAQRGDRLSSPSVSGVITSLHGQLDWFLDPNTGVYKQRTFPHSGTDVANQRGTRIAPAVSGEVYGYWPSNIAPTSALGYYIAIKDEDSDFLVVDAHLLESPDKLIYNGQPLRKGTKVTRHQGVIGIMDNSGYSNGDHTHRMVIHPSSKDNWIALSGQLITTADTRSLLAYLTPTYRAPNPRDSWTDAQRVDAARNEVSVLRQALQIYFQSPSITREALISLVQRELDELNTTLT
jgi:murein DD-endopeptidase MepM/ murein hydrolase activator NlpD